MTDRRYRDPDVLRELYWKEGMSLSEIGDDLGCDANTVRRWMDRHGIDRRDNSLTMDGTPWREEETLRELYAEKQLGTYAIADRLGCSPSTVQEWLKRHGIEAREMSEAKVLASLSGPVPVQTVEAGYESWIHTHRGETSVVRVHRLVAAAEHGTDAVAGMHVHHQNGVPWDNRPANLELLEPGEHTSGHMQERVQYMEFDEQGDIAGWSA